METLTLLFNECLKRKRISNSWRESTIVTLYKGKGSKEDSNSYHSIALESKVFKVFSTLLMNRISPRIMIIISQSQYGFMEGRPTIHAIGEVLKEIDDTLSQPSTPLYAIFIGYAKTSNSIDRKLLIQKPEATLGSMEHEIEAIKAILNVNCVRILWYLDYTTHTINKGVL
ncbi:hypothetical protein ANN_26940 [Periplaneta americana]|uniref:Uncharacterized protein n=1 Tax=Periplaneta americana TaxID=6978 RepID=A0ABQ8RWM8_PERAM|nr:hypothetical protein ANN_26940 [Periplaneta americana]